MGTNPGECFPHSSRSLQLLRVPNSLFPVNHHYLNWRPGNATSFFVKGSVLSVLEAVCRKNLELGTLKTYRHEVWVVSKIGSFTVQAKIHGWIIPSFTLSLSNCLPGYLLRFGTKLSRWRAEIHSSIDPSIRPSRRDLRNASLGARHFREVLGPWP